MIGLPEATWSFAAASEKETFSTGVAKKVTGTLGTAGSKLPDHRKSLLEGKHGQKMERMALFET